MKSTEKLFISVTYYLGGPLNYELRPISPNHFAFLKDGKLTGQTLMLKTDDDSNVGEVLVDLNVFQLQATKSD